MISEADRLRCTVDEYQALVAAVAGEAETQKGATKWRKLGKLLSSDAEWTQRGGETVLFLAREYGGFVLRNALAMAIALGIDDGEAGL